MGCLGKTLKRFHQQPGSNFKIQTSNSEIYNTIDPVTKKNIKKYLRMQEE